MGSFGLCPKGQFSGNIIRFANEKSFNILEQNRNKEQISFKLSSHTKKKGSRGKIYPTTSLTSVKLTPSPLFLNLFILIFSPIPLGFPGKNDRRYSTGFLLKFIMLILI